MKGQKARSTVKAGFEGGQLPLMQRIPKLKGFNNPFRVEYTPVNIGALDALDADEVTVQTLVEAGLVRPKALVKILGQGTLSRPVRVSAHAFSKAAETAITAAGGSVERVPLPFAHGRPPASGNALMNR
jgi:large subunit ribosomal protein L15